MDYRSLIDDAATHLLHASLNPVDVVGGPRLAEWASARTGLYTTLGHGLAVLADHTGVEPRGRLADVRAWAADAATVGGHRLQHLVAEQSQTAARLSAARHAVRDAVHLLAEHLDGEHGATRTGRRVAAPAAAGASAGDLVALLRATTDVDVRVVAASRSLEPGVADGTAGVLAHARQVTHPDRRIQVTAWTAVFAPSPASAVNPTPVPSVQSRPVTTLTEAAGAVERVTGWLREHPGRVTTRNLTQVASTATLLTALIARHLQQLGPDLLDAAQPAIDAALAWRQMANTLSGLRSVDPRPLPLPILANLNSWVQQMREELPHRQAARVAGTSQGQFVGELADASRQLAQLAGGVGAELISAVHHGRVQVAGVSVDGPGWVTAHRLTDLGPSERAVLDAANQTRRLTHHLERRRLLVSLSRHMREQPFGRPYSVRPPDPPTRSGGGLHL